METGENKNISLGFSDLDIQNSETLHLSLEVSPNNLSYCLLDTKTLKYIALKSITNPDIIDIINREEILKNNFSSSSVSYTNFPSTIIPNSLYKSSEKKKYIDFVTEKNGVIKTDQIHINDSTLIYTVDENISNIINQIQTNIKERNSSTISISGLIKEYGESDETNLFLKLNNKKMEIIALKNETLIFNNTFDVHNETDILYYTLFTYGQLELNPDKNQLYLLGNINKGDEKYSLLYEYIRNVKFGVISNNLSFSQQLKNVSSHQYYVLFNQLLCV